MSVSLLLLPSRGQQMLLLELRPCACLCYLVGAVYWTVLNQNRLSDARRCFLTVRLLVQTLTVTWTHFLQVLLPLSVLFHVFVPQTTFLQ